MFVLQMPSCEVQGDTVEAKELYGVPLEQLMANYGRKTFPVLDEALLAELAARYAAESSGPAEEQVAELLQPRWVLGTPIDEFHCLLCFHNVKP